MALAPNELGGPCEPRSLTLVEQETGAVLSEEQAGIGRSGDRFPLPPLQPDTSYVVSLKRPGTEVVTVTFQTGQPRPSAAVPVPELVSSRAWTADKELAVCAEVVTTIAASDRWTIVYASVGSPVPWERSTGDEQTIRLSTADTYYPLWGDSGGTRGDTAPTNILAVSLVTGEQQITETAPQIEQVSDLALCPPPPPEPPVLDWQQQQCSSAAGAPSSILAFMGALLMALRRRRE